MVFNLFIPSKKQGLHNITPQVNTVVHEYMNSRVKQPNNSDGLCTLFIKHTSASLIIQENADPSAKYDLENWLNRLVTENDPLYTHTIEGSDDMPAHIKSVLTATSLSIPIQQGELALGIWQGIYMWEHRYFGGEREIVIHIG